MYGMVVHRTMAWGDTAQILKYFIFYTPLMGEYDLRDSIVISKHIDWSTGHGINVLIISWRSDGKTGYPYMFFEKEYIDKLLNNPLSSQMFFYVLYENSS